MKGADEKSLALGEGFYWMAEKLAWGYDDTPQDLPKGFRLFRQAADLGFSDAWIRVGQLQEQGKGTKRDLKSALKSYQSAAKGGNYFALAHAAVLLSRSAHVEAADTLWGRFFAVLNVRPEPGFVSSSRGELLHDYVMSQLRLGFEPGYIQTLKRYRIEIVQHHQQLLEHPTNQSLERLKAASKWIELNLGPWPLSSTR